MKHFTASLWRAAQVRMPRIETAIDGFARIGATLRATPAPTAITYDIKPDLVRSFATSGVPFLTFYEFNDLTGWCRDTYFAPEHVAGYAEEIGKTYTVWTHDAFCAYRRHIFPDRLTGPVRMSFEVPSLTALSWFPLRICVFDRDGLYFQTDQKLVVERIGAGGAALTSWRKVPALRDSLPRLHARSAAI